MSRRFYSLSFCFLFFLLSIVILSVASHVFFSDLHSAFLYFAPYVNSVLLCQLAYIRIDLSCHLRSFRFPRDRSIGKFFFLPLCISSFFILLSVHRSVLAVYFRVIIQCYIMKTVVRPYASILHVNLTLSCKVNQRLF